MTLNRRTFLKQSTAAVTAALALPSCNPAAGVTEKNVGFQVWSIAKNMEKDLMGSLKLLAQIGYKEIELFGPYSFSTDKDKATWTAITPMVGFSQSGYFGRTTKEFNQLLKDHGLRTPAMHIGLDTLRNKMGEIADAAQELGQ